MNTGDTRRHSRPTLRGFRSRSILLPRRYDTDLYMYDCHGWYIRCSSELSRVMITVRQASRNCQLFASPTRIQPEPARTASTKSAFAFLRRTDAETFPHLSSTDATYLSPLRLPSAQSFDAGGGAGGGGVPVTVGVDADKNPAPAGVKLEFEGTSPPPFVFIFFALPARTPSYSNSTSSPKRKGMTRACFFISSGNIFFMRIPLKIAR